MKKVAASRRACVRGGRDGALYNHDAPTPQPFIESMASPFPRPANAPDARVAASPSRRWEARLFGAFRLTSPDGSNATPVGRKTRALVAYLLTTTEPGATRDRLAGLLWSERGEDQARASLRQMLYEMRALTSGHEPLIVLDRIGARVPRERATTDLAEMHLLAATNEPAALATLVGDQPPDLLTDLDGIDPGFDDWLALERTRRADERRRLVLGAAESAMGSLEPAPALRLAACLLERDPTDEAAARMAMEAGRRQGDRDGVRTVFARLKGALRTELGVEPCDETIEAYRRSNTPTVERVERVDATSDAAATHRVDLARVDDGAAPVAAAVDEARAIPAIPPARSRGAVSTTAPREHRRRTKIIAAVFGTVVVLLVCAGFALRWHASRVDPHVLRVDALRTPHGDIAGQALGVGFASTLGRLVFANDTTLDVIDAEESARATDESRTFAIDGAARSDGSRLHVDVSLRRASDGATLWSTTFSRPIAEIDALREQMAYRIAGIAICATGRRNPKVDAFGIESLRLLFAACAGTGIDEDEVVEALTKLLVQQPDFAHGWAMLALSTTWAAGPRSAEAAAACASALPLADRALALDPHDGTAYVAKSCAFARLKDWPQRMAVLERGRAADPSNATVLAAIAASLAETGLLNEAMPVAQRMVLLDPFDPFKARLHAELLDAHGDSPDAKVALQRARRRFPTDVDVRMADFRFNALDGDTNRALALVSDADRGFNLQPTRAALWKAIIIARAAPSTAHDDEAYDAFVESRRVLGDRIDLLAVVMLSVLHRSDEAFAGAADLDIDRDGEQTSLLFTTLSRPLRADPAFMRIAMHLGLLDVWQKTGRWPDFCSDHTVTYDCRIEAQRAMSSQPRALVGVR